jgi:hypothetical protein
LPVGKKDKNIFNAKLIFERFGLPCLPAGRRLRFSVPISKESKATGAITDIPIQLYNFELSEDFLKKNWEDIYFAKRKTARKIPYQDFICNHF